MKSKIHIIHGEGSLTDKRNHVLQQVNGNRSLILLSEIDHYNQYEGFNRNIQVGLASSQLETEYLVKHNIIIVEPYDHSDFKAFMSLSGLLEEFLKTIGKEMYIISSRDVKMSVSDKVEIKENDVQRGRSEERRVGKERRSRG